MDRPVGTAPVVARVGDQRGATVLLVRDHDGRLHATVPACPHLGQPLVDASLDTDEAEPVLECAHHAYRYRLGDGACVAPAPAPAPDRVATLTVHEVREDADGIRVRLAPVDS